MATIVTRSGKGSPLTHAEVDSNFTNLNTDKLELSGGTMTGNLSFGDNDKAIFGAGSDLQIYHDGSNSYVGENGTGSLILYGTQLNLKNGTQTETYITCSNNGGVRLYYDDAIKLTTTATGIDVTGTITADGLISSQKLEFNASESALVTTGSTAKVYATNSTFDGINGSLVMQSRPVAGADVYIATGATPKTVAKFNDGGDISFYEDTGTTAKFFWDASAESLGIGTSSPTTALTIAAAASASTETELRIGAYAPNGLYGVGIKAHTSYSGNLLTSMSFTTNPNGEAMRILANGNVGIGTSSPQATGLEVANAGVSGANSEVFVTGNTTGKSILGLGDGSNRYVQHIISDHSNNNLSFHTAAASLGASERMRIDSSGNLLVGTTTADQANNSTVANAGIALRPSGSGALQVSRSGGQAATFNRLTSDGDIAVFRKDGTTVGSIGVANAGNASFLYVGFGDTGLSFQGNTNDAITPINTAGSNRDNAIDLGSTTSRFKDLYLAGGVYLGGTGAANKLDDYEEGAWTPTYADASNNTISTVIDGGYATYTKVGRIVTVHARINTSGLTSLSGFSGELRITGLPFTSGSNRKTAFGTLTASRNFSSYGSLKAVPWNISIFNGANYIRIHKYVSSATESAYTYPELDVTDLTLLGGNRNRLEFSITYEAT